jgi:hypothetical protein
MRFSEGVMGAVVAVATRKGGFIFSRIFPRTSKTPVTYLAGRSPVDLRVPGSNPGGFLAAPYPARGRKKVFVRELTPFFRRML